MEVKILNEYPPNFQAIKDVFNPGPNVIYAYAPYIYNPSGQEIPTDIEEHEKIHIQQQNGEPESWWRRYLSDKQFRLEMETEAYAYQYKLVKSVYPVKMYKLALEEFARNLVSLYGLGITLSQAETAIRKYR